MLHPSHNTPINTADSDEEDEQYHTAREWMTPTKSRPDVGSVCSKCILDVESNGCKVCLFVVSAVHFATYLSGLSGMMLI